MTCETVETQTSVCIVCPAIPAVAEVPAQVITRPNWGWNASAYSAESQAGDCYTQFTLPWCMGLVIGFTINPGSLDIRSLSHAFYVHQSAGRNVYRVMEQGSGRTADARRTRDTVFRIERKDFWVSYLVDGLLVHRSRLRQRGVIRVGACLYAHGDGVD